MELRIYYQYQQSINILEINNDYWYKDGNIKGNVQKAAESIVKGAKRILLKKIAKEFENKNSSATTATSNLLPNHMYRILLTKKDKESWIINPEKCIIGDVPTKSINQK